MLHYKKDRYIIMLLVLLWSLWRIWRVIYIEIIRIIKKGKNIPLYCYHRAECAS